MRCGRKALAAMNSYKSLVYGVTMQRRCARATGRVARPWLAVQIEQSKRKFLMTSWRLKTELEHTLPITQAMVT